MKKFNLTVLMATTLIIAGCAMAERQKTAEEHYDSGIAYHRAGEHQKAIEEYNKAIELDPEFVKAYATRGVAYYHLGKHQRTIEDCTKAIELDPEFGRAYAIRGTGCYKLGEHQLAIKDYEKAIELNPERARSYYNLACCYSLQGDKDKAIEYLRQAIEKGYNNFERMKKDTDLDNIRNDPRFIKLIQSDNK